MNKNKKGFTLIELIVVVVVLAVLAAVAVPMISDWTGRAEKSQAETNRRTIELAIRAYMAKEGIDELTSSNLPPSPAGGNMLGRNSGENMEAEGLTINPAVGGSRRINPASPGGIGNGEGDLEELLPSLRPDVTGLLLEFGIGNPIPGSKSNYKVTTGGSVTVTELGKGWGIAYIGNKPPNRSNIAEETADNTLSQAGQD